MRETWLLCVVLLACGDDASPELELDERRFTLQSGYQPAAGTTPTLRFDDGMIDYYAGCNGSSGPFAVRGGKLVIDELSSDLLGCDEARHQQDAFFGAFLLADPQIELEGATLTLTGSDATLVFVEKL